MSSTEITLVSQILSEYYGTIIEKVATFLIKHGPSPLRIISKGTDLRVEQVKKALYTLIQHHIVKFKLHQKNFVQYSASAEQVLLRCRFARYMYVARTLYGDTAELLVEELLQHGKLTTGTVVNKVTEKLTEASEGTSTGVDRYSVYKVFCSLVSAGYIRRCPHRSLNADDIAPVLETTEQSLYLVPALPSGKRKSDEDDEPPTKRAKTDKAEQNEDNVSWMVVYDRFHQYLMNQAITLAIAQKVDRNAAEVIRTILTLNEKETSPGEVSTIPQSSHDIYKALPKDLGIDKSTTDQYLKLMVDDISLNFFAKVGDSGGGLYQLNFQKAMATLAMAHLESVVRERFGSKCLRIFRLLVAKRQIEQEQIKEHVMMEGKVSRELLYRMLVENYVAVTYLAKTPDYAAGRTLYTFSVNLPQLARMVLQQSYQAMTNLIVRREHETKENKRLLEKQQRLDAIRASIADIDEAQQEELDSMITLAERAQLDKVKHFTNKLDQGEIQLDDTIFTLQQYINHTNEAIGKGK